MLFIHPMWLDEVQRIGKQKCTPFGYALRTLADLIGFLGLLFLLGTVAYLVSEAIAGEFSGSLCWFATIPFGVGFISEVLYQYSEHLARRKQFQYDYERRVSTWIEDGTERTYTSTDYQTEQKPPTA